MVNHECEIIVFDGHDATGKTTLSVLVAKQLNGTYVKPYHGSLGEMIAWLWGRERFEEASVLARLAVERVMKDNPGANLLVFDRLWLTLFSVLPQEFWNSWYPLQTTILCWSDLQTTVERLQRRGEHISDIEYHKKFIQKYKDIAEGLGIRIIDTSNCDPESALKEILETSAILNIKARLSA